MKYAQGAWILLFSGLVGFGPALGQAQVPGASLIPADRGASVAKHFDPLGKPPSTFTLEIRKGLQAQLPLADKRDFDEAKKGFIAEPPFMKIMADAGNVAWDMGSYQWLLQGKDFQSIHPSLQRQAILNMAYGLYEVVPGKIYQVRGFDLANISFIKGDTGWIVFDPLTAQETARAALEASEAERAAALRFEVDGAAPGSTEPMRLDPAQHWAQLANRLHAELNAAVNPSAAVPRLVSILPASVTNEDASVVESAAGRGHNDIGAALEVIDQRKRDRGGPQQSNRALGERQQRFLRQRCVVARGVGAGRITRRAHEPGHAAAQALLGAQAVDAGPLTADDAETKALLRAMAVAGFGMMNIMLLSVSVWSGAEGATREMFHWLSAIIAVPVIAYAGQPFFRSALRALRAGRTNMDVPISIGVTLATGLSLYETVTWGDQAYFDGAVMLLFFLLAGRALDATMRGRTRAEIGALLSRMGRSASRGSRADRMTTSVRG